MISGVLVNTVDETRDGNSLLLHLATTLNQNILSIPHNILDILRDFPLRLILPKILFHHV
jgi:hypothetical protein